MNSLKDYFTRTSTGANSSLGLKTHRAGIRMWTRSDWQFRVHTAQHYITPHHHCTRLNPYTHTQVRHPAQLPMARCGVMPAWPHFPCLTLHMHTHLDAHAYVRMHILYDYMYVCSYIHTVHGLRMASIVKMNKHNIVCTCMGVCYMEE